MHDFVFASTVWQPMMRALSGKVDLLLPEFRGCGHSEIPSQDYGVDTLAEDVVSLLREEGIDRVDLVGGLGLGSVVALELLAQLPKLSRLLFLIATPARLPMFSDLEGWLQLQERIRDLRAGAKECMIERMFSSEFINQHPELISFLRGELLRSYDLPLSELIKHLCSFRNIRHGMGKESGITVFMVNPKNDMLCGSNLLTLPGHRVAWLEGGHFISLEQPDKIAGLMYDFLTKESPSS